MRSIGLIGGMSWESSAEYYRLLNEAVRERMGGLHSCACVLYSVDFAAVEAMQREDRWDDAGRVMAQAARRLERAGAELLLIATNTMHRLADVVSEAATVPLLHIADPTAHAVTQSGVRRVGLLGTRYTMEQDFYRGRLEQRFGLQVSIPDPADRDLVQRVIYEELCLGRIRQDSRKAFRRIIDGLMEQGAEGVILGCTEIGLLIEPGDVDAPLFDTTRLHAEAAVEAALADRNTPATRI